MTSPAISQAISLSPAVVPPVPITTVPPIPHAVGQMVLPHGTPRPPEPMVHQQHPPIPPTSTPQGPMGLPHHPHPPQSGTSYMAPPHNQGPMIPQQGFVQPSTVPYTMAPGPPPHGPPAPRANRFDHPPHARPNFVSPRPSQSLLQNHFPGHSRQHPFARMRAPISQNPRFGPSAGSSFPQGPPPMRYPGQGQGPPMPVEMGANGTTSWMAVKSETTNPGLSAEGELMSGVDDAMDIEETAGEATEGTPGCKTHSLKQQNQAMSSNVVTSASSCGSAQKSPSSNEGEKILDNVKGGDDMDFSDDENQPTSFETSNDKQFENTPGQCSSSEGSIGAAKVPDTSYQGDMLCDMLCDILCP